jgi:hypothetical protein
MTVAGLLCVLPSWAVAQSASPEQSELVQTVKPSLRFDVPSLTPTDTFKLGVDVALTAPAEYFEVRVRVMRPNGALIYQKTEVRHDVAAGTVSVGFERTLADLSVTPGRYPMEVRVLASGAEATLVESRILVAAADLRPLPLVVIARLACSPALDPSGRFALDPGTHDAQRRAADDLVALVSARSDSLTIGLSPMLLDEWMLTASGYQLLAATGVEDVPSGSEVPLRYQETIAALSRAAQAGRIEVLDVPFASPDIGGLQSIAAIDDLRLHYELGRPVYANVLGIEPSIGTILADDMIPADAAHIIAETGHGYQVCSPASSPEVIGPGVYRESSTGMMTLVTDPALQALLASGTAERLYDHLYDAATAEERASALVIVLDIGPGRDYSAQDVQRLLTVVDQIPWLDAVPAARAAQLEPNGTVSLVEMAPAPDEAPGGYWDDVAEARRYAGGLAEAWGADDPAAAAALSSVLVAEGSCWAGPDASYPFADRGRSFATTVSRSARAVFDSIGIQMRDVTLAARAGNVPLTIVSTLDRPVVLRVETRTGPSASQSTETTVSVRPADNFLTIPVDLGPAMANDLHVRVMAGDVLVAETSVTVRASYLDRLTTMAGVVLVLFTLLFFIRRRVIRADAGKMPDEVTDTDD